MNYKELERDARLGDYMANKKLEERREKLEILPIRDALGNSLTWCPQAIPPKLLADIDTMYSNISITNIDTDISLEEESFHSCRIEGADTTIDELFDIFRAKRRESKGDKMILNTLESPYIKMAVLHFYFVYMHPFCDDDVIIRTKLEKPNKIKGFALI